jgi:adenosine deaminase
MNDPTATWYHRVPKVELHLHLEGAIPLEALWQLVCQYGGRRRVPTLEALRRRFRYRNFPHFLATWCWKNRFLRSYDDFTFIAEAVARDLTAQHIHYAEVFFSPADFARQGLEVQPLAAAIRAGLDRVPEIAIGLVADLVRDYGPKRGDRTLTKLAEVRDQGVIGIGIGGFESLHRPEPFAAVYEHARELGFHTTAHAGEGAGPASVWGALRALHVERIGHGTRAAQDPALLDYLAATQTPLEMCPLSNVCTGVVASIEEHPIRRFWERGLCVTVNSDDPHMFGNSLAQEYELLETRLGFGRDEVRTLILNAARASWLPAERKAALMATLQADPNWTR